MKKQIPAVVLAIVSIALAVALYSAKQEIAQLQQHVDTPHTPHTPHTARAIAEIPTPEEPAAAVQEVRAATAPLVKAPEAPSPHPDPATPEESEESNGQRMMKNIAKLMENPAMNKMMEASQRGAIGAMYEDLISQFNLSGEEQEYFMDLLMFRQMTQMDVGMKMMSGDLSEEEREEMKAQMKDADELVKSEMKDFLNSDEDYEKFEFFEKTMAERMVLSQAEASLADTDHALTEDTYHNLVEMMHSEKENFDFSSNFQDETNMDMSPERFSEANLQSFADDLDRLNEEIFTKAQSMLTAEQFEAFKGAVTTTTDMQKSQLEMVSQMFGGGK